MSAGVRLLLVGATGLVGRHVLAQALADPRVATVAAPVRHGDGPVVAALSIVVPADGTNPHTYVPAVRAAARGISRALGSLTS